MKMKLTTTESIIFDTAKERMRIKRAFRNDVVTRQKLDYFMDLIEAQEWEKACTELTSEWWQGRDEERECPRLEFIGLLNFPEAKFLSYGDLVSFMVDNNSSRSKGSKDLAYNYKVESV